MLEAPVEVQGSHKKISIYFRYYSRFSTLLVKNSLIKGICRNPPLFRVTLCFGNHKYDDYSNALKNEIMNQKPDELGIMIHQGNTTLHQ